MLLSQILDDVGEIVAGSSQTFMRSRFRLAAGALRGKIGHVPTHDEVAQRRHARVFLKLPQRIDCKQIGRFERNFNSLGFRIRRLAAGGSALAALVLKETKWRSVATPLPTQRFTNDNRRTCWLIDSQMIGNQRSPRPFAVFDLDRHRVLGAAGLEFPGPPAPVPGAPQAGLETLREEREHIEHCGLAATIRTEQHRHRCQVFELDISQSTKILHLQGLDSRRWRCSVLYGHLVHLFTSVSCAPSFNRTSPRHQFGSSVSRRAAYGCPICRR